MSKTVLVCPLDWGLGHATRCVPIINALIANGANVIIAGDNRPFAFLKKEFPELEAIKFPGFHITYPQRGSMVFKMFFSIPKILKGIRREHNLLEKIIDEKGVDIVISDNRFGLWNKSIKTVFITHQLRIKCPEYLIPLEYLLYKINSRYVNKYNECWIPDNEKTPNLSSSLSHLRKMPEKTYFIGPLSRFSKNKKNDTCSNYKYDFIAILSGPEPQRTILEGILLKQINEQSNLKGLIVQGKTDADYNKTISGNSEVHSYLETNALYENICLSKLIICRSGYSSIMDIAICGKKAILIPTPGQTEQEYLAKSLEKAKIFYACEQKKFNLKNAIAQADQYSSITMQNNYSVLNERIKKILEGS